VPADSTSCRLPVEAPTFDCASGAPRLQSDRGGDATAVDVPLLADGVKDAEAEAAARAGPAGEVAVIIDGDREAVSVATKDDVDRALRAEARVQQGIRDQLGNDQLGVGAGLVGQVGERSDTQARRAHRELMGPDREVFVSTHSCVVPGWRVLNRDKRATAKDRCRPLSRGRQGRRRAARHRAQ
jgi:hypothetical protein